MNSTLRLFYAIDPGEKFWSDELSFHGADALLERIESGFYDGGKHSIARIRKRLSERTLTSLEDEIASSGGELITNASNKWPHKLCDLLLLFANKWDVLTFGQLAILILDECRNISFGAKFSDQRVAINSKFL